MGQLEGGVLALEWSPDGETVCLITGAGQMLLMTKVQASRPDLRPRKHNACSVSSRKPGCHLLPTRPLGALRPIRPSQWHGNMLPWACTCTHGAFLSAASTSPDPPRRKVVGHA